ncbi:ATP-binding protein [Embleya sp. NBC_00896]|nr:ATP-binding protein [Embleya sp. NBC_00896]
MAVCESGPAIGETLALIGPPGVGKAHIAVALPVAAWQAGHGLRARAR